MLPDKFACFYLGQSLGKLNRHSEALKAFHKTWELLEKQESNDHIVVLQVQSEQYSALEDFTKARECIGRASEIADKVHKGSSLQDSKRQLEDELQKIKKLEVLKESRRYTSMLKKAEEMERKRSYKEAIEVYSEYVAEKPEMLGYFRRGRCHYCLQQFKDALTDLEKCLDLSGTNTLQEGAMIAECHYYQGRCFTELGNFKKAQITLKKACDKLKSYSGTLRDDADIQYEMLERRIQAREKASKDAPTKETRKKEDIAEEKAAVQAALKDAAQLEKEKVWHVTSMKWYRSWQLYATSMEELLPASPPTAGTSATATEVRKESEPASATVSTDKSKEDEKSHAEKEKVPEPSGENDKAEKQAGKEEAKTPTEEPKKEETKLPENATPETKKEEAKQPEAPAIGEPNGEAAVSLKQDKPVAKPPAPEYPGPIFNDELILFEDILGDPDQSKLYAQYPLRPGLKEDIDYVLLPDKVWSQLAKTYGGFDLKRFGYPSLSDPSKTLVDVYLQKVRVVFTSTLLSLKICKYTVYVSRHETSKDLLDKCNRILTSNLKKDNAKGQASRLWRIQETDWEHLASHIDKRPSFPIGIDGTMIDLHKSIEELGVGDSTLIVVEYSNSKAPIMFQERTMSCPRLGDEVATTNDADLQKLLTLENNNFMKIPLKAMLNAAWNCGKTGLENLGNTCYMNSGLQCLSNCQDLTKYFLLELHKKEINKDNPLGQKGYLATTYAALLGEMWKGTYRAVNAMSLKKRIVVKAEQFSGYSQQDSQELILYVLDGLHEDLNRVKKKPYIPSRDYNGTPDKELSVEMWNDHLKRNQSVIVDLFCGQLKSRVVCPGCKKDSVTFDPFMALSVPIPLLEYLVVTFIYSDVAHGAVRLKLLVTEGSTFANVDLKLKDQLKLPATCSVLYALVKDGKIDRRLTPESTCAEVLRGGELYAYEYIDEKKGPFYLVELQCQYIVSGVFRKGRQVLCYPLVFAVPAETTVRQLKRNIMQAFLPFMKEVPAGKDSDRLNVMYEHYFGSKAGSPPYIIEIANNRTKTTRYLVSTKYTDCEFCTRGGHSDNCKFEFKDEETLSFGRLLDRLKTKRDLILNIVVQDGQDSLDVVMAKDQFEDVKVIKPVAEKAVTISLYDCLECFSNEEQLDVHNMWYCPTCKKSVQAKKKMDIYRLPSILVIHLKRFKHKASMWSSHKKIDDFVNYPVSGLDLKRYIKSSPELAGSTVYDLFAVSNHYGGLTGGHYTATCFNSVSGKWFHFNDSSVSIADEDDILSSAGYVLFYRRVESTPTQPRVPAQHTP